TRRAAPASCARLQSWQLSPHACNTGADQGLVAVAAVAQVDELLSSAGISIHSITVDALNWDFDYIERIDRLTTIAENRRNAALHEFERHRAVFGEMLRRALQDNEDSHLRLIETTPSTKQDAEQRAKDQGEPR